MGGRWRSRREGGGKSKKKKKGETGILGEKGWVGSECYTITFENLDEESANTKRFA